MELAQRPLRLRGGARAAGASRPATAASRRRTTRPGPTPRPRPSPRDRRRSQAPRTACGTRSSERLGCDWATPTQDITPRIAAADGRANPRAWHHEHWCYTWTWVHLSSMLDQGLPHHDVSAGAQELFQKHRRTDQSEFMASYRFYAKRCSNKRITADTTIEQAEKMCDAMYGNIKCASFQGAELGYAEAPPPASLSHRYRFTYFLQKSNMAAWRYEQHRSLPFAGSHAGLGENVLRHWQLPL
ncbi:unnamed protein product [Prorocentrum cordatum]|uniref:Uncharacterized protein n=1 Tax=Prorocentrum cordatum TaxID=2364126 RepID=A0ABN9TBB1_9DINO|nr:unnamed protein product [Polarella glacialis]